VGWPTQQQSPRGHLTSSVAPPSGRVASGVHFVHRWAASGGFCSPTSLGSCSLRVPAQCALTVRLRPREIPGHCKSTRGIPAAVPHGCFCHKVVSDWGGIPALPQDVSFGDCRLMMSRVHHCRCEGGGSPRTSHLPPHFLPHRLHTVWGCRSLLSISSAY
jgi:hypothetical protein